MAVVSGDVHHPLSSSPWDKREAEFAARYVEVAASLDVPVTLFVTGACVRRCGGVFKGILGSYGSLVEFGGHTYSAFQDFRPGFVSKAVHHVFRAASGSLYGPAWYQRWDIGRTVRVFENVLGYRIRVWRTHQYASNSVTYRILDEMGFRVVSDRRLIMCFRVRRVGRSLHDVYITAPPDGVITPGDDAWNRDWRKSILAYIEAEIGRSASIVFNLHPKRMAMLDMFETFREILSRLRDAGYRFIHMSETASYAG